MTDSGLPNRLVPALCAAGTLLLAGCNAPPIRDPAFAAVRPSPVPTTPQQDGAIYHTNTHVALFSDIIAHRVGDILTIRLVEKTDAKKKADTQVDQDNAVSIPNPIIFGHSPSLTIDGKKFTLENEFSSAKEFQAETESEQSNSLTGDITVTVSEVLPNGNLRVQGEKLMTLNRGHEHIRLSGIVRPYDIDPDNVVLSTKVADATIVYSGQGELADANAMGWLSRFFLSILFPF
jgi:flagellar L-ring protein precursor FlgH